MRTLLAVESGAGETRTLAFEYESGLGEMILQRSPLSSKSLLIAALFASFLMAAPAANALPVVQFSTKTLFFTTTSGTAPASQTVTLTTADGSPANVTNYNISYAVGSGWLSVFPMPATPGIALPQDFTVYINPGSLPAGTYFGAVQFLYDAADPSSDFSVAVVLTITGSTGGTGGDETITATPTSLSFAAIPGAPAPAAQNLAIATSDNASISLTGMTSDGNPWLLFTPTSASTPTMISVSVNPAGLPGGNYTGNLTITTPSTTSQIPVSLTVGGAGLNVAPAMLTINEPQNYGLSVPQTIAISATSAQTLRILTSTPDGSNWLQVDQNNATTPATITVRANDSGLAQGTYSGTVTIQVSASNIFQVPVTLTVGPPAVLGLQPSSLAFTYQIGAVLPAMQTIKVGSLSSTPQTFSTTTSTTDGAAWLTAIAAPNTTPGTVAVGLSPSGLAAGTYSGVVNIVPAATGASPQAVLISLTVRPAATPVIQSVSSAASFIGGAVAPGEIVSIFGSALGPLTLAVPTPGTVPKTFANVSVTFDGIPAPIYFASSSQTSVQVPYGIAMGQTMLQLTSNGVASAPMALSSIATFPGLFTADSTGQHQAAALNYDLSVNTASNPAARGTVLVLYGTGEGQTVPASVEGVFVPVVAPFPQTTLPVVVTIGGQTAKPLYAGETPGLLSGLFQINVVIPPNTPVGPAIPVQVQIGGQPSQSTATVAIQ